MWVDFGLVYDGLTLGDLEDATDRRAIEPGRYVVVGDDDADPAVAQVMEVKANGVVLPRVLPGHTEAHLSLIESQPT